MRNERPGLGKAVAALRYRDFSFFYVALLVAAIGGQFQHFGNILQVYDLTGSPFHLGLTGLARAIPTIVLSLAGGVIADRVDRLRFIMVTQALVGLLSFSLVGLTISGAIEVWHIYLVIFLGSALQAINTPARSAIIPNLVPREHLLNAIALNSTNWQLSNIVGPMLAGLTIAAASSRMDSMAAGFAVTYAINGVAHIVTLATLVPIRLGPIPPRPQRSPVSELMEGLAFVRFRSIILVLLATDCAATFFGHYRVLLPIFAAQLGVDAAGQGLLFAAPGAGSIAGAALVMSLGDFRHKGLVVAGSILMYCAVLVVLALSPWFPLSVGMAFMAGAFDSLQATPRNGVIQLVTPDDLRGRVSSFQHMLTNGVPSLGQAYAGALASVLGPSVALIAGATVCATFILGFTAARRDLRAADLGAEPVESPVPVRAGESALTPG